MNLIILIISSLRHKTELPQWSIVKLAGSESNLSRWKTGGGEEGMEEGVGVLVREEDRRERGDGIVAVATGVRGRIPEEECLPLPHTLQPPLAAASPLLCAIGTKFLECGPVYCTITCHRHTPGTLFHTLSQFTNHSVTHSSSTSSRSTCPSPTPRLPVLRRYLASSLSCQSPEARYGDTH